MTDYQVALAANAGAGNGSTCQWPGGQGAFIAEATWGGGSAKLQTISPQGTWLDVTSVTLNANGLILFTIPAGQIRVVIATSSAVYAWAVRL